MAQLSGIARIGRDAETRHTPNGDAVANLSLAFSYGRKDPNTNERPTQWVDGSLWGKRTETFCPYLKKGTQVYVVLDDVHLENFQKRDGVAGVKLAGRISVLELVGRPKTEQAPASSAAPAPAQAQASPSGFTDMPDDLPF